jgi:hypothetical protein
MEEWRNKGGLTNHDSSQELKSGRMVGEIPYGKLVHENEQKLALL